MTELQLVRAKFLSQVEDLSQMTPPQIARLFHAQGVKGIAADCYACAVSVFIRRVLPDGWYVSADRNHIVTHNSSDHDEYFQARTPPTVKVFMEQFDALAYPDLVFNNARWLSPAGRN